MPKLLFGTILSINILKIFSNEGSELWTRETVESEFRRCCNYKSGTKEDRCKALFIEPDSANVLIDGTPTDKGKTKIIN